MTRSRLRLLQRRSSTLQRRSDRQQLLSHRTCCHLLLSLLKSCRWLQLLLLHLPRALRGLTTRSRWRLLQRRSSIRPQLSHSTSWRRQLLPLQKSSLSRLVLLLPPVRRLRQAAARAARRSRARRRANCRCDMSPSLASSHQRPSPCRCHRCARRPRCHPSQLHGSRHRAGRCQRQKPHPWPRQRTQARPPTARSTAWCRTPPLSAQRAQLLFERRSRRSARSSEPRSTRRSSLEWTCAPPAHSAARHRQARRPAPRCAAAAALKPT